MQLLYGILHHQQTQHYYLNSMWYTKHQSRYNRYTLSLCVNFQSFFLFWIACDTPSITVDTTEQQVAGHNQPNIYIYIYTANTQQNSPISTTSAETFNTITQIRYNKNKQVHLGPNTTYIHILQDLCNPPDYFGQYVRTLVLLCTRYNVDVTRASGNLYHSKYLSKTMFVHEKTPNLIFRIYKYQASTYLNGPLTHLHTYYQQLSLIHI